MLGCGWDGRYRFFLPDVSPIRGTREEYAYGRHIFQIKEGETSSAPAFMLRSDIVDYSVQVSRTSGGHMHVDRHGAFVYLIVHR